MSCTLAEQQFSVYGDNVSSRLSSTSSSAFESHHCIQGDPGDLIVDTNASTSPSATSPLSNQFTDDASSSSSSSSCGVNDDSQTRMLDTTEPHANIEATTTTHSTTTTATTRISKPSGGMTRIPRIPNLNRPSERAAKELEQQQHQQQQQQQQQPTQLETECFKSIGNTVSAFSRVPRSANKSLGVNSLTASTASGFQLAAAPSSSSESPRIATTYKRGVSLSASTMMDKTFRSMSINESQESLNMPASGTPTDQRSTVGESNNKNVRYIIRHKPRESQVKIFSQKMIIKNVGSKIGSLEKANYVPGGGNVVIENRPLNWNAQAKIGSLKHAIEYQPSGGNVKIESRKLNWNANAKIGSLEYAKNYQPKGGNVKIESHKLNFKERARPRTDTGLIIIEANSETLSSCDSNSESTHSIN